MFLPLDLGVQRIGRVHEDVVPGFAAGLVTLNGAGGCWEAALPEARLTCHLYHRNSMSYAAYRAVVKGIQPVDGRCLRTRHDSNPDMMAFRVRVSGS